MTDTSSYLPWLAIGVAGLSLLISWRSHSLTKRFALQKRPYLNKRTFERGDQVQLVGPEAEHWNVSSIRLLWPLAATFMENKVEYDAGASITKSWLEPICRKLPKIYYGLIVSDSPPVAFALVSTESRPRPKMSKRWLVRIVRND